MLKNLRNLRREKKKGFTLMELIIVIAIIGIIALFAVPNFIAAKNNALKDSDVNLGRSVAHTTEVLLADGTIPSDVTSVSLVVPIGSNNGTVANADATGTKNANSIEKNIKQDTFVLKTKGAVSPLIITIVDGKVTEITETTDTKNKLYPKPAERYLK